VSAHPRVVRVLPEGTIDKTFDYLVPDDLGDQVRVGTLVRVELNRRRVGAWVVADDVEPPAGVTLRPIAKVTGWGPAPDLVDLARWAAWRWAGRRSWFLGTASPAGAVRRLPPPAPPHAPGPRAPSVADELAGLALARPRSVVRLPPLTDPVAVVAAAAACGPTLVLAPSAGQAGRLGARLRRGGAVVAVVSRPSGAVRRGAERPADDWAAARAGVDIVIGTRAAAWAPVAGLAAAVVLDEHEEVYQEEQTTTWHAREVVAERARRAGVPCVLVSPSPSLEALAWAGEGGLLVPPRRTERDGWPLIDVVDRRNEEPGRTGLYSEHLVRLLRSDRRVVCVLNRKGRARLLACATCGEATRCERCQASVGQSADGALVCRRCGLTRPVVCQSCGAATLKNLRVGVSRAREELEALVREPVAEISAPDRAVSGGDPASNHGPAGNGAVSGGDGSRGAAGPPATRVVVGTEAVLHQVPAADVVAFLDFDQELLAPRYRAAEQALALLVRGARLLARGARTRPATPTGRADPGRLVVQTRLPHHEVVQAALHADASRVAVAEQARRELLRFPPVAALAAVSGPAAGAFVDSLVSTLGAAAAGAETPVRTTAPGDMPARAAGGGGMPAPAEGTGGPVEVLGPADGRWLIRAADHAVLCDTLAATPRPATGRLRIEVDPTRI
jgi:primosomal protein N' (replication factor Y)